MNVGLIIYGHLDIVTGGFIYDRHLVEFLRSHGDNVDVFAFPWRTYPANIVQNFSRKVVAWAQSLHLDILLEDELNHPSLFLVNRRIRKAAGCPIVSIVHHLRSSEMRSRLSNALYERVEKKFLQGVDGFIFPSRTTEASVRDLLGEDKPFIVANPGKDSVDGGASPDDVLSRSNEQGALRILFVGNLIPRKGLHTLLDALTRIPKDQWTLNVVGNTTSDENYTESIRKQVRRLDLENSISFLGTVTGRMLSRLYRSSHVLAVPSSYEGYGIVYVEAMAFGLPAIASTMGAAQEIVQHGVNGFLIAPGDSEALASCMSELNYDRKKLAEMGLMALQRYGESPSWAQTGARIRSLLMQMANGATPRGSMGDQSVASAI